VDREAAMTGQLQIPVGVTWNQSTEHGDHLSRISDDEAKGGVVFAWHSQTWAMHMFQIKESGKNGTGFLSSDDMTNEFYFEKGGGKQGGTQLVSSHHVCRLWVSGSFAQAFSSLLCTGRNWCRCDQVRRPYQIIIAIGIRFSSVLLRYAFATIPVHLCRTLVRSKPEPSRQQ